MKIKKNVSVDALRVFGEGLFADFAGGRSADGEVRGNGCRSDVDGNRSGSDGNTPVVATGDYGRFIAMPVRAIPAKATHIQPVIQKEEPKMEETKPTESVNVMDELNATVDDLRGKLKMLFDESATLTRKVKEAVLAQKQKEREFVQARRAIERIKMAI